MLLTFTDIEEMRISLHPKKSELRMFGKQFFSIKTECFYANCKGA